MDPASDEARMITNYSNNQNGMKSRDSRSNAPAQVRLQNEFSKNYAGQFAFEVKRGEEYDGVDVIKNEDAGLYLMAFDLGQPWATHRKYEVFEDKHAELFGRPEVTADKIVMCHVIMGAISDGVEELENKAAARYVLTKYMLLFAIRQILQKDALSGDIMGRPEIFVRDKTSRSKFHAAMSTIVSDLVIDLNGEIEGYGDDFDYRGSLRDQDWVKKVTTALVGSYLKLVKRGNIKPFSDEWKRGAPSGNKKK